MFLYSLCTLDTQNSQNCCSLYEITNTRKGVYEETASIIPKLIKTLREILYRIDHRLK